MAYVRNMNNNGYAEGNISFLKGRTNSDGSVSYNLSLAVDAGYKDREGNWVTDFLAFEAFRAKSTDGSPTNLGPFATLEVGDKIAIDYTVRPNDYQDADGNRVYKQVLQVQQVAFKETKNEKAARQARKATRAALAPAPFVPAPAPVAAPVPAAAAVTADIDEYV